jgi:hypothetical protein
MAKPGLLPIVRAAARVAMATEAEIAKRAFRPNKINAATAIPAAGQKTATSTWVRSAKPSPAARK